MVRPVMEGGGTGGVTAAQAVAQSKQNAALVPLTKPATLTNAQAIAAAQALINKMQGQVTGLEAQQVVLNNLSTASKAAATEAKAAAENARTAAVASAASIGQNVVVVDGKSSITKGTTARQILRASLASNGFPESIIDSSLSFVQSLLDDGLTEADAIQILYYNKDFTTKAGVKIASPFYNEFTSLGEGKINPMSGSPYSPKELMAFSLGAKATLASYGASSKFTTQDALKKYINNNVSVSDLDKRAAEAKMATAEENPLNVAALQKMGFIGSAADLFDFYMDPTIGQQQLEMNKTSGIFAKQAMMRSNQGVTVDTALFKQLGAKYAGTQGAEGNIAKGFATIGDTLQPEAFLSGVYQGGAGMTAEQTAQRKADIQNELIGEQFLGQQNARTGILAEQEQAAFKRRSGNITANRFTQGSLAGTSTIGMV